MKKKREEEDRGKSAKAGTEHMGMEKGKTIRKCAQEVFRLNSGYFVSLVVDHRGRTVRVS